MDKQTVLQLYKRLPLSNKSNELLTHAIAYMILKIIMLSGRKKVKPEINVRVSTLQFHLYKILDNGNYSIVTES